MKLERNKDLTFFEEVLLEVSKNKESKVAHDDLKSFEG